MAFALCVATVVHADDPLPADAAAVSKASNDEMPDIEGLWVWYFPEPVKYKMPAILLKTKITPTIDGKWQLEWLYFDLPKLQIEWLPEERHFEAKSEAGKETRSWFLLRPQTDRPSYKVHPIVNETERTHYFKVLEANPDFYDGNNGPGNRQIVLSRPMTADRIQSLNFLIIETAAGLDGYSETTGRWDRIRVPRPKDGFPRLTLMTSGSHLAAVVLDDQLVVFNGESGKWSRANLPPEHAGRAQLSVGVKTLWAQAGDQLLGFSAGADHIGRLTIPPEYVGKAVPSMGQNSLTVQIGDQTYALSPKTGEWTSPDGKPTGDDAAQFKVFPLEHGTPTLFRRMLLAFFPEANIQIDHRTNSLVVATADDNELGEIQAVLTRLDVPAESEPTDPFPTSKTVATSGPPVSANSHVVFLKHADAVDASEKLNTYYQREYATADPLTNSVTLRSSDAAVLRDLVKSVEAHDARTGARASKRATMLSPAARRLVAEIARQEVDAVELAKKIRKLTGQFGKDHPEQTAARLKLQIAVAEALNLKFQLEALQLEDLRGRLSRLEQQIGERKALRQKIVDRRVEELIEGDATRWDDETEMKENATAQAAEDSTPRVSETRPDSPAMSETRQEAEKGPAIPVGPTGVSDGKGSKAASAPALVSAPSGDPLAPETPEKFGEYQRLALELVKAQENVQKAETELAKVQEMGATNAQQKAFKTKELQRLRNQLEFHRQRQNILREEYAATLRDLELQVESAQVAVEQAQAEFDRTAQLFAQKVVPEQEKSTAERTLKQAKLAKERLDNRLALYRKAGDVFNVLPPKLSSAPVFAGDDLATAETLSWERLGLKLRSVSDSEKEPRVPRGLLVTQVKAQSPAAVAGFRENDILVGLGQWETVMPQNVTFVLAQTKGDRNLKFVLIRDAKTLHGTLLMRDAE